MLTIDGDYENISEAQLDVLKIEVLAVVTVLLRNLSLAVLFKGDYDNKWRAYLVEFVTLVFPMLIGLTTMSELLDTWILIVVFLCVVLALTQVIRDEPLYYLVRSTDYFSGFRTSLLIGTAISILACDFIFFSFKFNKTATYGISVMDTGTAAFVLAMAMLEFIVIHRPDERRLQHDKNTDGLSAFFLLLGIGIVGEIFFELSGYNRSEVDYGEHWNFFFTLAFLKLFTISLPYPYNIPVGIILGIVYQAALFFGLEHWIMRAGRDSSNIFDSNREGFCSLFGYIFLYSLSLLILKVISSIDGIFNPTYKSAFLWIFCGGLAYVSQLLTMIPLGDPSRRIANIPYVFAMLSVKSIAMGLFQFVQIQGVIRNSNNYNNDTSSSKAINLLEAISGNCLLFVSLSSIGTGLIVSLVDTHTLYNILLQLLFHIVYCLIICSITYAWHHYNIMKGNVSLPAKMEAEKKRLIDG